MINNSQKLVLKFIPIKLFNIKQGEKYAHNNDRDLIVFSIAC